MGRMGQQGDIGKVLVAQLGARRHYLVPAALHANGLLERFVTDLYLNGRSVGRLARGLASATGLKALRRLSGRSDSTLPASLVHSYPGFGLEYRLRTKLAGLRSSDPLAAWLWAGPQFAKRTARDGFGEASAVYAYSSAALELFESAKKKGVVCVLDHATAPRSAEHAMTARQAERYPGWGRTMEYDPSLLDAYTQRQRREAELADVILCGSTFVKRTVESEFGIDGSKIAVVPLGLRSLPGNVRVTAPSKNGPLRVLFVGDEAVRKGIGDLASAVQLLGSERCEVRVAGNLDLTDLGRREVSRVATLLGPVPRNEMADQYRWADLCVLPSVSDTFGLVILEAMAHGVPVITTPNTGGPDVIEDGEHGYIVPIMSPEELRDKLRGVDEQREILAKMARSCLSRSRAFAMERYTSGLVGALKQALGERRMQTAQVAMAKP